MPKLRNNVQATPQPFPSPTGGWNSIDNIAAMPPEDAVSLINLFPEPTYVRLRGGNSPYVSMGGSPVKTLMKYNNATFGDWLLAAANNSVYDVTSFHSGTPSTVATGTFSDTWEWVNYSTPGGQFLVAVNGDTSYSIFNGAWSAASVTWDTGVTPSSFTMITSYAQRLFFADDQTLLLYYLPVNVYQGQISAIDLGAFLPLGGSVAFLGTWTRDNASQGMNDMLVVGTTEGEVLVYQGTNPDDASAWNMVGRFEMGHPVSGHRQLCKFGPDMVLISDDGVQSLANYLAMGVSKALTTQISRKIGNAVTQVIKQNRTLEGWDLALNPANNQLIVNVPQQAAGTFEQYVVNTITGAWCRFQGINAYSWIIFGDALFWGADNGTVMWGDKGPDDNGQPIVFDMVTAFQRPQGNPMKKRATMCQPFITINAGSPAMQLDVNVNYVVQGVTSPIKPADVQNYDWFSVEGLGSAFAVHLSGSASGVDMSIEGFDLAYESGAGFV